MKTAVKFPRGPSEERLEVLENVYYRMVHIWHIGSSKSFVYLFGNLETDILFPFHDQKLLQMHLSQP